MNEVDVYEADEISLFDLLEKLREGWRWIIGGLLLGGLGAAAMLLILPNKYEALAIVQVGQVGQIAQVSQVGQVGQVASLPAEPPTQAVERMKTAAFQLAVAQNVDDKDWIAAIQNGNPSGVLTLSSPKAALNLIDLKAKADSPEEAKRIAEAAISELAKRHAEIAKPAVDRLRAEADLAREKLKRAESELDALNKLVGSAGVKDDRFTQLSLMTNLRVQKESEVFYQRQMLATLDGALTPPNTQPAKAIEPVFISDKAVSPKKGLLLALGLVGGLLAGIVLVFVSDAWRQARLRRQQSVAA